MTAAEACWLSLDGAHGECLKRKSPHPPTEEQDPAMCRWYAALWRGTRCRKERDRRSGAEDAKATRIGPEV